MNRWQGNLRRESRIWSNRTMASPMTSKTSTLTRYKNQQTNTKVHGWINLFAFSGETGSTSSDNLWMSFSRLYNPFSSQWSPSYCTSTRPRIKQVTFKTSEALFSSLSWTLVSRMSLHLSIFSTLKDRFSSERGSVTHTTLRHTFGADQLLCCQLKSLHHCCSWQFATLLSILTILLTLGCLLRFQLKESHGWLPRMDLCSQPCLRTLLWSWRWYLHWSFPFFWWADFSLHLTKCMIFTEYLSTFRCSSTGIRQWSNLNLLMIICTLMEM